MKKVELLAPVGSYDAMVAAVQNGADAIYLGGKSFGARQYANNFGRKELIEVVTYCHIRGVKVFVTVNTLVLNEEFKELAEFIDFLYSIDVDAVIIQDLGVLRYIRNNYPDFELHSSTQMTIHNLEGIKLVKELGIKRVVLAREMAIDDINYIKQNTDIELEVFVHGALCLCYSGQCLMSSLIGGRSGNRGKCAQPCRLPYKLVDLETKEEIEGTYGEYLLSPRDLNTIEDLKKVLDTSVESLKIEGRMKKPEYVALVVAAYRRAIDMYYNSGNIHIDIDTKHDLTSIFNRRFTKGYLLNEYGKKLMSYEKPGNRGVEIGKITGFNKKQKRVKIALIKELNQGDGIKIINQNGEDCGLTVNKIYFKDNLVNKGNIGETIEIEITGDIHKGDQVFKTSDIKLLNKAQKSYKDDNKKISINGAVKSTLNEELEIHLWDKDGNHIKAKGEVKAERAINRPLDEEKVREQVSKLGNTPYILENLEVELEEGLALPIKEINNTRRIAIDMLSIKRSVRNNREKKNKKSMDFFSYTNKAIDQNKEISLRAYVNNLDQLEGVLNTDINEIYYSSIKDIDKAYSITSKYDKKIIPAFSRIMNDNEIEDIKSKIDKLIKYESVLVGNHGQLNIFKDKDLDIYTDFSFNVFNNMTIEELQELDVKNITLSPELTLRQIDHILSKTKMNCEIIVYGHIPVMISKYCVIKALIDNKCGTKKCGLCTEKKYGLKDRYGVIFPVVKDDYCRMEILNSKKLLLLENIKELISSNIKTMRLQFTNENKNEIISIVNAYTEMISKVQNGKDIIPDNINSLIEFYKRNDDYTKGHFFRGVE